MFSHMACICHFVFYVLPRASYGYMQCGFIPSAVWRFSNIFSSPTYETTTPPVMVVSSGLSSVSSVTVALSLTGFPVSLDQHGMVPPPPLMLTGSGGVLGSVSVPQQQPASSMPPLAYANYAMGSSQVGFFLRVEPPIILYLIYVWCPTFILGSLARCHHQPIFPWKQGVRIMPNSPTTSQCLPCMASLIKRKWNSQHLQPCGKGNLHKVAAPYFCFMHNSSAV